MERTLWKKGLLFIFMTRIYGFIRDRIIIKEYIARCVGIIFEKNLYGHRDDNRVPRLTTPLFDVF